MSRIGKKFIPLGAAKVTIGEGEIKVEGPKGKLTAPIPEGISAAMEDGGLTFTRASDEGPVRALHGLARSLAANCVRGVTEGFKKELQIIGVGYRVNCTPKEIELHLGYSHPINFPLPEGISANAEQDRKTKAINLVIEGIDKQKVGQVAANIRQLRKPEPYKGKGIRYANEHILRKAGKAGK